MQNNLQNEKEFADEILFSICEQFLIPLKGAGRKVSIRDLLEQYYDLVEYAKKTLSLAGVLYLVTWQKIFMAPRSKGSSDILLMIRILFTVPVSNAKLERIFSKLKRVKTNFRCSLGVKGLENILRIMQEGSSWETFDPI